MSFVHLHSHTHFSLLDGAARLQDAVKRAAELKMPALAITDHGNLFGAMEFYTACKAANIKPIIGMEAYMAPRERGLREKIEGERTAYHLVVLAKNEKGFQNLIKLSSMAYMEGLYYKPRIDMDLLRRYSEGLIVSSACMSGQIAHKLNTDRRREAMATAETYIEIFGDDFYFEIQDHKLDAEGYVYPMVYDLAKEMGVKVIATNDNHYLKHGDHEAHDILLCLQTGKDRDDPSRMRYGTEQLYMKSPDEMYQLFKDKPQVLENTLEIAEKVDLNIDLSRRLLPRFQIPAGESDLGEAGYLRKLAFEGARKRYPMMSKDVTERMEYELGVIEKMGFVGYFLITQDFINAARERDIPVGLGRGSAAGSIVAYNLGITDVDPLRFDLLFERFLNPERVSMPDIDIDFCVERRDEVLEYVREKYGKANVAQIITFGTMASRGVIRDVSRVLKVPLSQADVIAKMVPEAGNKPVSLEEAFSTVPELKEIAESDDIQMQQLVKYSRTLEGIARNMSKHAAGVIIAPEDITNYAPICKTKDGDIVTQWTMGWCEKMGLLKMDFLGLRNLTVIKKAEDMIRARHDPEFRVNEISQDDPATYELFGKGLTVGVFQFESSGMQEYLKKLKPSRIEDLVAMNALYRPGPMDNIDDFIDRKYGRKEIKYLHQKLEPILAETYGVIVYQEQVMRIASDLGGFSLAQADLMRRAMGKKNIDEMKKQKSVFVEGCKKNGIPAKTAGEIFDLLEKFAEYGFNKSHSVAYAIIGYQTAWLKTHYPVEFMSANLTSEFSKLDRVVLLMDECRKIGLTIRPPDVNYSVDEFVPLDDKTVAFGMAAIKNVGTKAIKNMVRIREEGGTFASLFDLVKRVDLRQVNKKVLESLAMAGAMDSIHANRAQVFSMVETAIEFGQGIQAREEQNRNQFDLFGGAQEGEGDQLINDPPFPDIPDWPLTEKLKKERELLGFYISGHPLEPYRNLVELFGTRFDPAVIDDKGKETPQTDRSVFVGGQIASVRTLFDKRNNKMAFVRLEDFAHSYEAVVFGSVYPQYSELLKNDAFVFIHGLSASTANDDPIKLRADKIYQMDQVPELFSEAVLLKIPPEKMLEETLRRLKIILHSSPGKKPFYMDFGSNGDRFRTRATNFGIKLSLPTLTQLCELVGSENVRVRKVQD